MNLPAAIYAIRWLIRDTFRQARASGIFWLMLGVSALCIAVCLSVSVQGGEPLHRPGERPEFLHDPPRQPGETEEAYQKRVEAFRAAAAKAGVDVVKGQLTLAFGAIRVPLARDSSAAVHYLEMVLAAGVAGAAGILLALIWTAGFLPAFLEPSAAAVLLAKPVPRWSLLLGKYTGVLIFVAFQAVVFVGGTWLALAARTGVWDAGYLLCVPLLLLEFAVFYSISALLAVCTRSTVVCVFGSILFWFLCLGMNLGRHAAVTTPELETLPATFGGTVEAGYWIMPKPADLGLMLFNALRSENDPPEEIFARVEEQGAFHPEWSVLTSLAFAGLVLLAATRQFVTTDY